MLKVIKTSNNITKLSNFSKFNFSSSTIPKRAILALANGSEDLEAVTVYNLFIRAQIPINMVKVDSTNDKNLIVTCSRGIKMVINHILINYNII